jgi:hypothetical protein
VRLSEPGNAAHIDSAGEQDALFPDTFIHHEQQKRRNEDNED